MAHIQGLCVTHFNFIVMLQDSKPIALNEKHYQQYTDVKDTENVSSWISVV